LHSQSCELGFKRLESGGGEKIRVLQDAESMLLHLDLLHTRNFIPQNGLLLSKVPMNLALNFNVILYVLF
jgi:hypothetical protein